MQKAEIGDHPVKALSNEYSRPIFSHSRCLVFFLLFNVQRVKIFIMVKAFLKFWALILGAGLFFAFSFTVGIIAGMLLFIELDTRDLTEGEEPYSSLYVLALPPEKNGPPEILPFYRIDPACIEWDCNLRPINTSQYSFLLPHPEGKLHAQAWEEDDVKVIALSPGRQLIENKKPSGGTYV